MSERVLVAAERFARGQPLTDVPPSLRVWAMAKSNPALLSGMNILQASPRLWMECEAYAAAEGREARRQRAQAEQRAHANKTRVAGRGR